MKSIIENKTFDEERTLYFTQDADIKNCTFAGPADGESVLKESRDVRLFDCTFSLRYPLWHVKKFEMTNCSMDDLTRAAIWYSTDGKISTSNLFGIKAVRECSRIQIKNSKIISPEFGWKSSFISLVNSEVDSEYIFMDSSNVSLKNVQMKGKYSFQYMKNLLIEDSTLDTKDAFWHSQNVTVKNSVLKGEYLAWFSDGLTLINCKISGTQPLCYCKNLRLENCTMENCDLSFEYSDVQAEICGHIDSVKNPKSGIIICDSVGEIIRGDEVMECTGQVKIRNCCKCT